MFTDDEEVLSVEEYAEKFGYRLSTARKHALGAKSNKERYVSKPREPWISRQRRDGKYEFIRKLERFELPKCEVDQLFTESEGQINRIVESLNKHPLPQAQTAAARFLLPHCKNVDMLLGLLEQLSYTAENKGECVNAMFEFNGSGDWYLNTCSETNLAVAYAQPIVKIFIVIWQQAIEQKKKGFGPGMHKESPWIRKIAGIDCEPIWNDFWKILQNYCFYCAVFTNNGRSTCSLCAEPYRKFIERAANELNPVSPFVNRLKDIKDNLKCLDQKLVELRESMVKT